MTAREFRLVLTVNDFDRTVAFFRGALGMEQPAQWPNNGGQAVLLDGGHATLEIFDAVQAGAIDRIEIGRRVAGQFRLALQTADSEATAKDLLDPGAESSQVQWQHLGAIPTCD
jgi:catechol 2,3-dioxygenase-like lactoylglutathione lyase family enzyme